MNPQLYFTIGLIFGLITALIFRDDTKLERLRMLIIVMVLWPFYVPVAIGSCLLMKIMSKAVGKTWP